MTFTVTLNTWPAVLWLVAMGALLLMLKTWPDD